MKDDEGIMSPLWYNGNTLPNILIDGNAMPDNEESYNHDYQNDDHTVDETDGSDHCQKMFRMTCFKCYSTYSKVCT